MRHRPNTYRIESVRVEEREPIDWQYRLVTAALWLVYLGVLWVWGEWISEVMW